MTNAESAFLNLVKAALHSAKPEDPALSAGEWKEVFRLAALHKLLPLVLDTSMQLPSLRRCTGPVPGQKTFTPDPEAPDLKALRQQALQEFGRQVIQENEFLNLILALRAKGLEPLVVKGALCRCLYPKPMLRPSVDDDLFIPAELAPAFHAAILEQGLLADEPEADPAEAWELSYHMPESPLYVELHKCLFEPESPVFKGFNSFFSAAFDAPQTVRIQDVDLLAPSPQLHLLFLILHAYKHFLHSGFGLRIVADICLFSRSYADEIDFEAVRTICAELRCDCFTAAVYKIGAKYLDLPAPAAFAAIEVEEAPLLEDVLSAGLHGTDIDRLHSANITLRTVADARAGAVRTGGLRASLFPPRSKLVGAYPFLEKRPWLLPVAWARRAAAYLSDRRAYSGAIHPTASLRIGKERVSLLEAYHIVDKS